MSPKSIAAEAILAARGFRSAVRGALEADRERWILWIPAAFGCDIALYFTLPREPLWWSGPLAAAALCALAALGRRHSLIFCLTIALLIPALGFTASQFRTWRMAAPILTEEIGPVRISGRVEEIDFGEKGVRMVLADPAIPWLSAAETPHRVRARLSKRNVFAPGERVSVRVVLRPPSRPAAPGAFDFARFAYFQRLGAVGFALGDARRVAPSAQNGPLGEGIDAPSGSLERLRHAIAERIRTALPGERGAVAVALITGFREGIPEPVQQNMRDSGLAHLLAISGLHVGLVAGTVFLIVRGGFALVPAIALRWPIKKWAAVSAAAIGFGYLFLAGATEPTQRAFLMLLITVIGVCLDRGSISMRLVAWAALFILLLSPESLLSVSFQLSFAAVTALVAVYETITARRERAANEPGRAWSVASRAPRYILQLGLSSMIATLATAPFALYHFNRVAGYGLLANLAAVPLTAFVIMPLGLLAVLLMPLGLEAGPLYLMGQGIGAVLWVAKQVASLPGATALVPAFPYWGLVAVTLGGRWLCIWRGPWRWLGLAGFAAASIAVAATKPPDVLVLEDGRLVAVRGADERLVHSSRRRARFTGELWLRLDGQREAGSWPVIGAEPLRGQACGNLGYIFHIRATTLAVIANPLALEEDCRQADIVIAAKLSLPRRCEEAGPDIVIARYHLWRKGGHAIRIDEGGIHLETVEDLRGIRPWSSPRNAGQ